jgi:SAM-dependent methyltransferase
MLGKKFRLICKATGLNTGKLLDIGSGSGHFLSGMKNAGWDTLGIEINDKARSRSAAKFGLEVMKPEMISSLEQESFDCITLWHVLEHFQDPFSYVLEISRLLKPGGICIAAMPNCLSYDAIHYGPYWAAYDVPRHLWHFNRDTFGRFSLKSGLKMIELYSLPLDVFYISMLSEKYKGTRLYFVRGVLRSLWFSFRSLFNRDRSSSLVYILGK